jgi:hypothetical protein
MKNPPVLILSLPRSGSSWIGAVLGSSPDVAYLREPLTQSNLMSGVTERTVIHIEPDKLPEDYKRYADNAFSGLPIFGKGVVVDPRQWVLTRRRKKRLIIKEVNPLACRWLIRSYKPRIIFLVRHPAAVALSYAKMGWTGVNIRKTIPDNVFMTESPLKEWKNQLSDTSEDYWDRMGAWQGAILRLTLRELSSYRDCKIVKYETMCRNAVEVFTDLFDFAGLSWNEQIKKTVLEKSSGGDRNRLYETSRDSMRMIDAWRSELSKENLNRLRIAYEKFELPWYQTPDQW